MKEIIVLKKHELYKLLDCLPMPMITDEDLEKEIKEGRKLILFGKERKIEQVPESWEELKELCKSIKGNKKDCGGAMWFEFPIPKDSKLWLGKFLCIDEKGQIGIAEKTFGNDISITIFADSLTPARQYQIIKSLIDKNWRANK